jgi:hypothetical protein
MKESGYLRKQDRTHRLGKHDLFTAGGSSAPTDLHHFKLLIPLPKQSNNQARGRTPKTREPYGCIWQDTTKSPVYGHHHHHHSLVE